MIITIVIALVMIAAFVGMILCAKKQDVAPMAKPGAVGLLVVVVICAIWILSRTMGGGGVNIIKDELKFAKSMSFVLGQKFAEKMPGAKTLVIVREDDYYADERYEEVLRNGLKEGLSSGISDVKFESPKVKRPPKDSDKAFGGSFEEMVKAKDINALIAKNKDCKLIIFMIGLPRDAREMKIWSDFNKSPGTTPKVALFCPDIKKYAPFVAAGLMPVIVIHKPNADYDSGPSSTLQECFDKRYILVTQENIKSVAETYPDLFTKPE